MELSGTAEFTAPRERVFAFVTDPASIAACGPGLESVDVVDPQHARVRAKAGMGFLTVRVVVDVEIAERAAPDRAVVRAHGEASPGGSFDAVVRIVLREGPAPTATTLDWAATVSLSGMIAGFAPRLAEGAGEMIARTFDCVRSKLAAEV